MFLFVNVLVISYTTKVAIKNETTKFFGGFFIKNNYFFVASIAKPLSIRSFITSVLCSWVIRTHGYNKYAVGLLIVAVG